MIHLVLQPEITDDARQRARERGILLGILSLVAPMCGPVFGIGGIFVAQWFLRPQTGFASLGASILGFLAGIAATLSAGGALSVAAMVTMGGRHVGRLPWLLSIAGIVLNAGALLFLAAWLAFCS